MSAERPINQGKCTKASIFVEPDLTGLMTNIVTSLPATQQAKAYIIGVFTNQAKSIHIVDFSDQSLVLAYVQLSRAQRQFVDLTSAQKLGDWIFWLLSFFPEHTKQRKLAETIGQLSYLHCYRLVPSWAVYEELSDMLPIYTRQLTPSINL